MALMVSRLPILVAYLERAEAVIGNKNAAHWILRQNALDFVTKRTGLCDKTHWILRQNALDFATKRTGFCNKTH